MFGVPVGFIPRASIPEPGVDRASGVLAPSFQQSNLYGFGFKLPYYRVLGPSADATITPFPTTTGGLLVEGQYRRRFTNGGFDVWGVIALTDGHGDIGGAGRGAFAAVGNFDLPDDFKLDFDLNRATDETFLTQYDYTDADQLTSIARVLRTRASDFFEIDTVAFQSLVEGEDSKDVPFVFPELTYRKLIETPGIGGRLGISANSLGILRKTGSNMFRAGGAFDWTRDWTLPHGVLANATASALVDLYQVWENPDIPDGLQVQAEPAASVELRWPLVRHTEAADHVIEPIVQLVYSSAMTDQQDIPNEDSRLPEFDETNLFSINRFPGFDRLETGAARQSRDQLHPLCPGRLVDGPDARPGAALRIGGRLRRGHRPRRPLLGLCRCRLVRSRLGPAVHQPRALRPWPQFPPQRVRRRLRRRLRQPARGLRLSRGGRFDPILGPQPETNEIALDARVRVHRNWEVRGLWRYDVATNSNLRAGAGITYGNECAEFDLSVSRRYTSSDNLPPSTSIGFNLRLAGIGTNGQNDWPARVCTARGI